MIRITVIPPEGGEQVLDFSKNSVMIGRAAANDVCIDQGGVSRYHATITLEGNVLVVQDLGSTNGTLHEGKKIQTANIKNGDRLVLGEVELIVEAIPDEKPVAARTSGSVPVVAPEPTGTLPPGSQGVGGHGFGAPPAAEYVRKPTDSMIPRANLGVSSSPVELGGLAKKESAPVTPSPISAPIPVAAKPATQVEAMPTPVVPPPSAPPKLEEVVVEVSHSEGSQKPAAEPSARDQAQNAFFWQALQSFLAPVWHYITDDAISEIMINGPTEIYIEKKGKLQRVSETFTPEQIQAAVLNIAQYVGRRVSEEEPYLDARLPDGSRVAVLLPPCSRKGASMAIRKFSKEKLTLEKLQSFGSLTQEMITYLRAAVELKKNIIISGGTSSGKTSLLNVVSGLIPDDERIITIEDSAELQLRQDHVLPMETKPADKKGRGLVTIRDLVKASLRMRPDRIVVGEIRGGEALDLLQAMNTGHSGSMATVHASSPQQALTRLETLSLFSGIEIPLRALREQVASAIEVVIQASRLPDHSRKVTHISEVRKLSETGEYVVADIFRFARESSNNGKIVGRHVWTGSQSMMMGEMELCGMTDALSIFSQKPPAAGVVYQSAGH